MCGVFGVLVTSRLRDTEMRKLDRLSLALEHRGPDGSGRIEGQSFSLGMHRLSIMGVAEGQQPLWDDSRRFGVLGNGEIYNFPELRTLLEGRGHKLRTGSDIEVVPHLISEFGLDGISRLRGMFALVVFDSLCNQVHLIRDRLGEKPLVYFAQPDSFWFSSELTPLIRSGVVQAAFDPEALGDYLLYGFVPEDRTIIQDVKKVPPGCILTIDVDTCDTTITRYWNAFDYVGEDSVTTDQIRQSLRESVQLATQSDVPVAVALSGGLDSSIVAALARESQPNLRAFTVGYSQNSSADESSAAAEFAQTIDLPITHIELDAQNIARDFGAMCSARDEPITDSAGSAYLALTQAARNEGFPVLLNGQGGDELFWGYPWVREVTQRAFLATGGTRPNSERGHSFTLPKSAGSLLREIETFAGTRINKAFSRDDSGSDATLNNFPLFEFQPGFPSMLRERRHLLAHDAAKIQDTHSLPDPNAVAPAAMIKLLNTYLRSNGLAQMDRLTMHSSVEARTPLVDYKLVELMLSTQANPASLFASPKQALREAATELVPSYDLNRPKRGFTPPIRTWNRMIWQTYKEEIQNPVIAQSSLFQSDAVHRILKNPTRSNGQVNQMALRLLTLELWYRGL